MKESVEEFKKYKNLVDLSSDAIILLDKLGRFEFVNKKTLKLTGYKKKELVGKHFKKLVSLKYLPKCLDLFQRQLRGLKPIIFEIEVRTKKGKLIPVEINGLAVKEKGKIVGVQVIARDVTEKKEVEEELKKSEERLKILFEYATDAIYLNDLKGNFIDGNKVAEKLIGYKRGELIGKSFLKLKILPPGEISKAAENLAKNALGQATGPDEFTLIRKDGTLIKVETRSFPVKIKGKTLVLRVAHDISERSKSEEELKKLNQELQSKVKELERFKSLAVGRELRMIELKKKIRELERLKKNEVG